MQGLFVTNSSNILDKSGKGLYAADVRSKLLITVVTSIVVIIFSSIYAQGIMLIASLIYATSIRKPKVMIITYIIIALIMCIAIGFLYIINLFVNFMEGRSYLSISVPFMRMITMINVVIPLAFTINIQSLLTSLKSFKLPLFIYLPISVMIRFIPSFLHDIKQIIESLKTRGVEVKFTSFFKHPIKMGRYLFMPLLFRSLRTSEELGIAAELKGLGLNDKMKPYKRLYWKSYDTILILLFICIVIIAFLTQKYIEVPESLRGFRR